MQLRHPNRLEGVAPELRRLLTSADGGSPAKFSPSQITRATVWVAMRDGVRLATDLYLPPTLPAPAIVRRSPYGRANPKATSAYVTFSCHGYAVVSQDVRGTGDSEPEYWDYYVYESEDSYDCIHWVTSQAWFGGFLGSCGGSYDGQTQWCMAMHPRMSAIVPEVSGLGIATGTAHLYSPLNAYASAVGKGTGKAALHYMDLERHMLAETLAGGYFNAPLQRPFSAALLARYPQLQSLAPDRAKRWLWEQYCALTCSQRATFIKEALGASSVTIVEVESLPAIFGRRIAHDAHMLPSADPAELCRLVAAPPLMITGWYDWGLNDALATWQSLRREARESVRSGARLIITPAAHNAPGYQEDRERHPELQHNHRLASHADLLLHWYATVRESGTDLWPRVIYYLMGANDWRVASDWPVPETKQLSFYLGEHGTLGLKKPSRREEPDWYVYDPDDPTPTIGGSIVSSVYPPGSVDVRAAQERADVLTYTTPPFTEDFDVVGPLRAILYASSSATDTDFVVRLSDVFPDGRAVQLQSGILRTRHRDLEGEPELLEPNRIYCLEIDMWATANRFKATHRLRIDISSADFPRFDRNSNRGGLPGEPLSARQNIYHDPEHSSRLIVHALHGTCTCEDQQESRRF